MRFVLILEENRYVTDKGRFPYFRYFKKLDVPFQKSAPINLSLISIKIYC